MRSILLLLALSLLSACDGLFGEDPTTALVVATDQGRLVRLDATDDETSQLWSAEIPASSTVSLLVDGGTVYAASGSELAAFDLESGDPKWSAPHAFGVTVVNVAGPLSGAVFALTFDDLVAVDAATGEEIWRQDLNLTLTDAADEALVAGGGTLILGGDPIRRLDPGTGAELEVYDTPDSDIRALQLLDGTVYAGLADGIVALDASTLIEQWFVAAPNQVDNLHAAGGSVLYSVLGGGVAAASTLGAAAGAAEDGEIFQHVAIDGDQFLGVRADGRLVAWEREPFSACTATADCTRAWEVDGSSATSDALAVGDDAVYFSSGGILEAVASIGGAELWMYQTEGSVVAVTVP
jgi:outer membrane protein assembly factor BamB